MPDRLSLKYAGVVLAVAMCVAGSSPALAGFQWVAPSDSVPAPPLTITAPAPQTTSAPEIISPVVITGTNSQQSSDIVPLTPSPPASAASASSPVAPLVMQSAPPPQQNDNGVVRGFAKSVPLAVALRQILPNGYAFSIGQDVDMGTLVSFQGGKPWREVLQNTLDPAGLAAREQGQMVAVGYAMKPAAIPAPAPQPMPAKETLTSVPSGSPYQAGMEPKAWTPPASSPDAMQAPVIMDNAPPPPPVAMGESWTAERGDNLRKVLEGWSARSHVEFDWLSEYDYPLEASFSYTGNFESAVRDLLTGFEGARPQPVAELHTNPNLGQMVLVVQTRGNTNSD